MNTCDKCKHWELDEFATDPRYPKLMEQYKDRGECDLFGDINDYDEFENHLNIRNNVCYGADVESYGAHVVVMAKFGCIHWEAK